MTSQEQANKEIVRRLVAAFNEKDRETYADLIADDVVHYTPSGDAHEGKAAFIEADLGMYERFPDNEWVIDTIVAEDDMVAIQSRLRGTAEGEVLGIDISGKEAEIPLMEFHRVEDGKIAEVWAQMSTLNWVQQVGAITDLETQYQYMSVLTRVLRHNLRNDLGTIIGYAEAIADDEADAATHADSIRTVARELVALAEKAQTLEQTAVQTPIDAREIDLTTRIREVVRGKRKEYPAATISVSASQDECWMRTDPALVENVLSELVENAIVHNDTDAPGIVIELEDDGPEGNRKTVRVLDDGPGIPDHELEPIQQETEDPLMHGSSVGLWAVKWGVDRLDGELAFGENDPRGSVVEVRLPDLEDGA